MLRDKRRSLCDMIVELELNGCKISDLLAYTINRENDNETTLFEAVRDLFDDVFAKELEEENRDAIEEMYRDDERFEREMEKKR